VILNWQKPLWEEDQEIVKRSGRDELMWVAIHMCKEAMLGISLYSYLYLKLVKMLCLSLKKRRLFLHTTFWSAIARWHHLERGPIV
jgi:hypothetical protein